jgi:predicted site-specific integrase-resolvase
MTQTVNLKEAAEILGLDYHTFHWRVNHGKYTELDSIRKGKERLFRKDDILEIKRREERELEEFLGDEGDAA